MKTNFPEIKVRGLTLFELLIVISVLLLLAAVFLPALTRPRRPSQGMYCENNLKQVGLAFRVWEGDNNDRYPMAVPAAQGGCWDAAVGFGAPGLIGTPGNFALNFPLLGPKGVFGMFVVMSNELNTPKILFCPSAYQRTPAPATLFGKTTTEIGRASCRER